MVEVIGQKGGMYILQIKIFEIDETPLCRPLTKKALQLKFHKKMHLQHLLRIVPSPHFLRETILLWREVILWQDMMEMAERYGE